MNFTAPFEAQLLLIQGALLIVLIQILLYGLLYIWAVLAEARARRANTDGLRDALQRLQKTLARLERERRDNNPVPRAADGFFERMQQADRTTDPAGTYGEEDIDDPRR